MPMQQHYVVFFSPGTFVPEQNSIEIDSWNVDKAVEMAHDIVQRHNARPYGFQFVTRGRHDEELDARELDRSGTYFLGGTVRTKDEVLASADPEEETLRRNVENNNIQRIITNTNSWLFRGEFRDNDTLLDVELKPPSEAC